MSNDIEATDAMAAMRAMFGKKLPTSAGARRKSEQKIHKATDGRSLRATGRTEQINIRATPEVREQFAQMIESEGTSTVEWLEKMVADYVKRNRG